MAQERFDRIVDKILPDMAARQPAEGDLEFPEEQRLCCPDEEPSSDLAVEGGAPAEGEKTRS